MSAQTPQAVPGPGVPPGLGTGYEERAAARRWPLMVLGLYGLLAGEVLCAVLAVRVNPTVESPPVRPSRYYANGKGGRMSVLHRAGTSATWIVPTRHPDRLEAALRSAPVKHA